MTTGSEGSVSRWLCELKAGNAEAAQPLWERYFGDLVRLARRELRRDPQRQSDDEDVAISGFAKFCDAAARGRYPDLVDRHGLWRLLVRITADKARDAIRHAHRQKRGGGRVLDEAALAGLFAGSELSGQRDQAIAQIVGDAPTPEFAAMIAEQFQRLFDMLDDGRLREIAVAKMEGYSNAEIARQQSCSLSTVERSLRLVRKHWKQELPHD